MKSVHGAVPRLWPGSTVICLGTGPSLTQEDVDYCRGQRVIAINDAYKLAPWADVLYACDGKWWDWNKGVPQFSGLKFGMTRSKHLYRDVTLLRHAGETGLCLKPDGVCTGRNSGYQAVNVAVHLGAVRILLLGYDMSRDPKAGRAHFFGEHAKRGTSSPYPEFRRLFETIVKPLRKAGVEVINCTRRTQLTAFPQMLLEEALPAKLQVAS